MMNDMRKLLQETAKLFEDDFEPDGADAKTHSSKQVWVYTEEKSVKMSGQIPIAFINEWIEATQLSDKDDSEDKIKDLSSLLKEKMKELGSATAKALSESDDDDLMRLVAGRSMCVGDSVCVGFGSSRLDAKSVYEEAVEENEFEEQYPSWTYP